MKVVLFCGGLGLRLRDVSEHLPKPMVPIGSRPMLWHIMKYYAYYGHNEFILCLGFGADVVKNYFLHYDECLSNDFVLTNGGKNLQLFSSDIYDWRITFADTGINANIGQRLKAVEKYLEDDEVFLANYSDGLTDLPTQNNLPISLNRRKSPVFSACGQTSAVILFRSLRVVLCRQSRMCSRRICVSTAARSSFIATSFAT